MLPNVMVALLGYALWVTLKHLLKHSVPILPQPSKSEVNHAQLSATKALHLLSMLHSADIVLPTIHGRNIRMRRITEPTAEQTSLPRQLDLSSPTGSKSFANVVLGLAIAWFDPGRLSSFSPSAATNLG